MVFRAGLLWLSNRPGVVRAVRGTELGRRLARRFVAGDSIDSALAVVRELDRSGITATLDLLGEAVRSRAAAAQARDAYGAALSCIAATGVPSHVSLKLTQLGLDIGEDVCSENVAAIIAQARVQGSFVRIDMEGSAHTARTLALFTEHWHPAFGDAVGVVLQSALRRTAEDLGPLLARGARVRLCKGAYREPARLAFPRKRDVDANYVACMERLLRAGNYPAIATHDERIINHAQALVRREGIPATRFEFQMLFGVRRDLQRALRAAGYGVRVYVPFGEAWYPYLVRRLAERPANLGFVLRSLVTERLRGA